MSRVAGPWERRDGRLVRRTADGGNVVVVAVVTAGPAETWSTRTALRPNETTYGYATAEDAQRWADFELGDAGFTLTPGPLDPPPLVERQRPRGCLAPTMALLVVAVALAVAVGIEVHP